MDLFRKKYDNHHLLWMSNYHVNFWDGEENSFGEMKPYKTDTKAAIGGEQQRYRPLLKALILLI